MTRKTTRLDPPADHSCFSCGADWAYLGTGRPSPECPDCGSPATTPIGTLTFEDINDIQVDDGSDVTFKRSLAIDETGREFRFLFSLESEPRIAKLERLVVRVESAHVAVDLNKRSLTAEQIGLPDIRPQVRLAVGHRQVRIAGSTEVG